MKMEKKKKIYSKLAFILSICVMNMFSIGLLVKASTPTVKHYWTQSSLTCLVPTSISSSYGFDPYNAIVKGLKSWNSTDAPTISTTSSISSKNLIIVGMNDFGATGWDGNTRVTSDINRVASQAIISLNTNNLSNYTSVSDLWRAIASHEMGHALGLGHNTTFLESSIMKTSTVDFYNYLGTTPKLIAPTTADETAMNSKY